MTEGEKEKVIKPNNPRKAFDLKYLLVIVVPLIVLVLGLMMKKAAGPYWLGPNSDPSYQYLINSLHVLEGKTPSHFEHPGTTLQILGAIVFKSFHLFDDNSTIVNAVLTKPELYLDAIFLSMFIPFVLILIVIGSYSYSKSKSVMFACLIQSTALVFCKFYTIHIVLPPIVNISPEMLIIVASFLCVLIILRLYFKEDKKYLWEAIAFGVVCAVGFISKTTFIPLLLLPVLLLLGSRMAFGSRGEEFDGFVDAQEIEFIRNEGISRIKKIASTESRLMLYAARNFEKEGKYEQAFYSAYKAMESGFPNIDKYVCELGSKFGDIRRK